MSIRVRFAPSPTGQVHIGNVRVAIYNWLFARHMGGRFLLRIEDTDLKRSTPEAIATLLEALQWLGLDHDEPPVYQSRQHQRHAAVAADFERRGLATRPAADGPLVFHLSENLFDDTFITPGSIVTGPPFGKVSVKASGLVLTDTDSDGAVFSNEMNWGSLPELEIEAEDGACYSSAQLRDRLAQRQSVPDVAVPLVELVGSEAREFRYRRRCAYFDDLVLGRLEKPLESMKDFVIVRSDGSPVFHLANVVDDADMDVTHVLRGNDHVENTFRHLFLWKALGRAVPKFAHFPMIVNDKGKPYSKRDGDAYVGDFRHRGILPEVLLNFLALCGWSPGDDREVMNRDEMIAAFSLERVRSSAAQFNLEKLQWMNAQRLMNMPEDELVELVRAELAAAGVQSPLLADADWLRRLVAIYRPRLRTLPEFVADARMFFVAEVEYQQAAIEKALLKKEAAGLAVLKALRQEFDALPEADWTETALHDRLTAHAAAKGLKMGEVAQPLRVAVTGGLVSPGLFEMLPLIGRERSLGRIDALLGRLGGT